MMGFGPAHSAGTALSGTLAILAVNGAGRSVWEPDSMRHVPAVVLLFSSLEEDSPDVLPPPLAELQVWLRRADSGQLMAVDGVFGC